MKRLVKNYFIAGLLFTLIAIFSTNNFTAYAKTSAANSKLAQKSSFISINNTDEFVKAISSAIIDKKSVITLNANNYSPETYNLDKAVETIWSNNSQLNCTVKSTVKSSDNSGSSLIEVSFNYINTKEDNSVRAKTPNDIESALMNGIGQYNSDITISTIDPAYANLNVFAQQLKDLIYKYNETTYIENMNVSNSKLYLTNNIAANIFTVHVAYKFTKDQIMSMNSAVDSKVKEIVSSAVTPGMTEYQKELALHDYIAKNTSYDYKNYMAKTETAEDHTAYGVLINKIGVCDGYSMAFKLLLKEAGIESSIVTGTINGGGHAWNIVKLDNEYYQVDVTFDAPFVNGTTTQILTHTYFNITDDVMSKDHVWEKSKYPLCVAVKYSLNK